MTSKFLIFYGKVGKIKRLPFRETVEVLNHFSIILFANSFARGILFLIFSI